MYDVDVDQQDPKRGMQNLLNIQELNYPRINQNQHRRLLEILSSIFLRRRYQNQLQLLLNYFP